MAAGNVAPVRQAYHASPGVYGYGQADMPSGGPEGNSLLGSAGNHFGGDNRSAGFAGRVTPSGGAGRTNFISPVKGRSAYGGPTPCEGGEVMNGAQPYSGYAGDYPSTSNSGFDRCGAGYQNNNRGFNYASPSQSGPKGGYYPYASHGPSGHYGGMNSRYDRLSQAGANLRAIDWRYEELATFQKNFYQEHPNISKLTPYEVERILHANELTISGAPPLPKPIRSFEEACLPDWLMREIRNTGFRDPYPIQIMGWPVALRGRDMIGIAQTGSGKTLAYLLPGMLHLKAQPPLRPCDGPIVLVLAPTRELAMQIKKEADKFGSRSGLRNCCVYGGVSRSEQIRELRKGVEILIATPGRLLDFLETGDTNLKRVTYLVLDEADRMLDMGFEPQMTRIVTQIRPDRQTLMWSATWPKEVQSLARDFCKEDPVKVTVGSHDLQANININQVVEVCPDHEKHPRFLHWLYQEVNRNTDKILVFCETKKGSDILCRDLKYNNFRALAIHGDKEQRERDRILADFKQGKCHILIATDVASRGLDIKNIDFVVNYDVPKTIQDYVHRIGRTGRAGETGTAITFFTLDFSTDKIRMAKEICKVIRDVGQVPPEQLVELSRAGGGASSGNSSGRYGRGYGGARGGGRGGGRMGGTPGYGGSGSLRGMNVGGAPRGGGAMNRGFNGAGYRGAGRGIDGVGKGPGALGKGRNPRPPQDVTPSTSSTSQWGGTPYSSSNA